MSTASRRSGAKKKGAKANKRSGAVKTKSRKSAAKARSPKASKNGAKGSGAGQKATKDRAPTTKSPRAKPPKDKRQLVQERKILRSQSRWLQKALFALDKAEDDHARLAEVRGEAHVPMAVTIDGTTHRVNDVTDSLRDSVMDRLEDLRVTLRQEHALMG